MKKVLCGVIAVVMMAAMVLSLSGCGEESKYAGYWATVRADNVTKILHLKSDGTFESVMWRSSSIKDGVASYFEEKGISFPLSLSEAELAVNTLTSLREWEKSGTWEAKDGKIILIDSETNDFENYVIQDDEHLAWEVAVTDGQYKYYKTK